MKNITKRLLLIAVMFAVAGRVSCAETNPEHQFPLDQYFDFDGDFPYCAEEVFDLQSSEQAASEIPASPLESRTSDGVPAAQEQHLCVCGDDVCESRQDHLFEALWANVNKQRGELFFQPDVDAELQDLLSQANPEDVVVVINWVVDNESVAAETLIMRAAWQGRHVAVRLLCENGANVSARNRHGMTALTRVLCGYRMKREVILENYAEVIGLIVGCSHLPQIIVDNDFLNKRLSGVGTTGTQEKSILFSQNVLRLFIDYFSVARPEIERADCERIHGLLKSELQMLTEYRQNKIQGFQHQGPAAGAVAFHDPAILELVRSCHVSP
jgi:hypothetical protein